MKKLIALFLCLTMILGACAAFGEDAPAEAAETAETPAQQEAPAAEAPAEEAGV